MVAPHFAPPHNALVTPAALVWMTRRVFCPLSRRGFRAGLLRTEKCAVKTNGGFHCDGAAC